MHKRPRRPLRQGRHPLLLGSVSLFGVSAYELWVRFEDFWAWTSGIRHLSSVRRTPFLQDMAIVFEAPEMQQLGLNMLFLIVTMIFGLICLIRRNRARGAAALMAMDVVVAGIGAWLGLYSLRLSDWTQVIKLIPLALIFIGCALNLASLAIDGPDPRHPPRRPRPPHATEALPPSRPPREGEAPVHRPPREGEEPAHRPPREGRKPAPRPLKEDDKPAPRPPRRQP